MHPSGHSGLLGEVGYLLAELAARPHRLGHQLPAFHDGAFVVRADAVVATAPRAKRAVSRLPVVGSDQCASKRVLKCSLRVSMLTWRNLCKLRPDPFCVEATPAAAGNHFPVQ
jgi:hypothetical protein